MKDFVFTPKLCVTQEKYDLLTALHGQRFFSAVYKEMIQVLGSSIYCDNLKIDQITSEEQIDLLWSEYLHAASLVTSNDLGLRVELDKQQLLRKRGKNE